MDKSEFSACLCVLEDTINKKDQFLDELIAYTKEQEEVLSAEVFSMESFAERMDKKAPLIDKINEFDAGFEGVFVRIKPVMEQYKKDFEQRIRALQGKIRTVLEKGAKLCALEEQNRTRMEVCLGEKKLEIKNFKKSSRTVSNYYKNMSGATASQSFFMDKKK